MGKVVGTTTSKLARDDMELLGEVEEGVLVHISKDLDSNMELLQVVDSNIMAVGHRNMVAKHRQEQAERHIHKVENMLMELDMDVVEQATASKMDIDTLRQGLDFHSLQYCLPCFHCY